MFWWRRRKIVRITSHSLGSEKIRTVAIDNKGTAYTLGNINGSDAWFKMPDINTAVELPAAQPTPIRPTGPKPA